MANILRIYTYKEAKFDLVISIILSILFIVIIFLCNSGEYFAKEIGICLNISAPLLGFLLAAYSLLLAFPKNGHVQNVLNHKDFPRLFDYFILAIFVDLTLLFVALIGVLIIPDSWMPYFSCVILFFAIYTIVSISRIISLLYGLTQLLFPNN